MRLGVSSEVGKYIGTIVFHVTPSKTGRIHYIELHSQNFWGFTFFATFVWSIIQFSDFPTFINVLQ